MSLNHNNTFGRTRRYPRDGKSDCLKKTLSEQEVLAILPAKLHERFQKLLRCGAHITETSHGQKKIHFHGNQPKILGGMIKNTNSSHEEYIQNCELDIAKWREQIETALNPKDEKKVDRKKPLWLKNIPRKQLPKKIQRAVRELDKRVDVILKDWFEYKGFSYDLYCKDRKKFYDSLIERYNDNGNNGERIKYFKRRLKERKQWAKRDVGYDQKVQSLRKGTPYAKNPAS